MRKVFPYIRKYTYVLYGSHLDEGGRAVVLEVSTNRDCVDRRRKELEAINPKRVHFCVVRYKRER